MTEHHYQDLINLFDTCFRDTQNTRLIRGDDEPVYIPANSDKKDYHRIEFAHGYFSSALHEVAHWCIAGKERRQLVDFGYWYSPDGRSAEQQHEFEKVEVKPQAIEWIFSYSCNKPFRISVDNLNGESTDIEPFKQQVFKQVQWYCQNNLPSDAEIYRLALCKFYQTGLSLDSSQFRLEVLS